MKKNILISVCIFAIVTLILSIIYPQEDIVINYSISNDYNLVALNDFETRYNEYLEKNFFNGESVETISNKINRYLSSTLSGKGEYITRYSLDVGVDPYLAASVILHETGCQWTCSYLARVCNNFGGNKGGPGCNGGSYRKFSTMEEGLNFAIDKLARYYNKGYTTPEQINPSYAESKTWAEKINKYMNKLKS